MRNLNSILIEGVVRGDSVASEVDGVKCRVFVLSSKYPRRAGEDWATRELRVRIMAGGDMATGAVKSAREGRGARVVGQLVTDPKDGGICIEAEHIEYRPVLGGTKSRKLGGDSNGE